MLQRPPLGAGKYGHIQKVAHHFDISLGVFLAKRVFKILFHQDYTTSWSAQGFMGSGGNKMTMIERGIKQVFCDQSGRVRHIAHNKSTDTVCDITNSRIIPVAAVS